MDRSLSGEQLLWLLGSLGNPFRIPVDAAAGIADPAARRRGPALTPILVFDEAVSNLDRHIAENFARAINTLKGQLTMIFITHPIPGGLRVDEMISLGAHGARIGVMSERGQKSTTRGTRE